MTAIVPAEPFPTLPLVIAAMAMLVVVTVVGVVLVVPAINGSPRPPSGSCPGCPPHNLTTPLGTVLAIGAPSASSGGGGHWVNFTVQSAGGGLALLNLAFQVQTPGGGIAGPSGTWFLYVVGITGYPTAEYSMYSGAWMYGSNTTVTSGEVFALSTGSTDLTGLGDDLVIYATGGFDGSLSVAIP